MVKEIRYILMFFVVVCTMMSCKPRRPSGVISDRKMQAILYDYHLAQAVAEQAGEDTQLQRYLLVQSVFKKHGVTEAQFDSSMIYYNTNPKLLLAIYSRLEQRYQAEAKALGLGLTETEIYASYSQYGDTANVWNGQSIMYVRNDGLENIRTLTMQCDTTFHAGDSFRLNFMTNFLVSGRTLAYAFLTIHYGPHQTQTQYRYIGGNFETSIELKPEERYADVPPTSVSITFFHQPDAQAKPGYLVITRPSLLRMHDKTRLTKPLRVETPEEIARRADSLRLDSLRLDSLRIQNERRDSASRNRMTPEEFRNSQPVERRINVVKERPLIRRPQPVQGGRGYGRPVNSNARRSSSR